MWAGWSPEQSGIPATSLRPIVKPGASWWVRAMAPRGHPALSAGLTGAAVVFVAVLAVAVMVVLWPVVGVVSGVAAAVAFAVWLRVVMRDTVLAPTWTVHGQRISGDAFKLLEDIDSRFAYAEGHIRRLPTGIDWREIDQDVRALLWEAAEHGARASALATEIHELRYAAPGTPQAALKRSLEEQRGAHFQVMHGVQREAEQLARVAGNAVAAARVALARVGSLAALRSITPSRRAFVAAGALAEARLRLEALAEAWADLDESTLLAAEQIRPIGELPDGDEGGAAR